ncbi:hypothetical protein [Halogeometricum limi]|uniref:hypothetical protein n=1 Tax=Halogeometricum limi TaxID=555875 RepID=UPI0015871CED|nr:hypothetical protein [Halogeometricum limi]
MVSSRDCIAFRHRERDITVEAVEADGPHRELAGRWQLQYRHHRNDAESRRVVGHVTSESEALGALFEWMERINRAVQSNDVTPDVVGLGRAVTADTAPQSSAGWLPNDDGSADESPDTHSGPVRPGENGSRERVRR